MKTLNKPISRSSLKACLEATKTCLEATFPVAISLLILSACSKQEQICYKCQYTKNTYDTRCYDSESEAKEYIDPRFCELK